MAGGGTASGADADAVVLDDPRAIRALAHPARLAIIDELYAGSVLTATECAQIAGLTPSAMSYHLRALQKWGVVERAEAAGDGRERPWRAAGKDLHLRTHGLSGLPALTALIGTSLGQLETEIHDWARRRASESELWADVGDFTHSVGELSADETRALTRELADVATRHLDAARSASHEALSPTSGEPVERRRVSVWFSVTPRAGSVG